MPTELSLRAELPADRAFLFQVYADVRREEIAGWGLAPAQQEAMLRMQFQAQQNGYRAQFRQAEYSVVCLETGPIGSMIVAAGVNAIGLVDIALLREHRARGFGTQLLQALISRAAAAQLPLWLTVRKENRAQALYARLGFTVVADDGMNLKMERSPI